MNSEIAKLDRLARQISKHTGEHVLSWDEYWKKHHVARDQVSETQNYNAGLGMGAGVGVAVATTARVSNHWAKDALIGGAIGAGASILVSQLADALGSASIRNEKQARQYYDYLSDCMASYIACHPASARGESVCAKTPAGPGRIR